MNKYKQLACGACFNNFEKETKEIKRRLKVNPNHIFYCSLSCAAKNNTGHLISFANSKEHLEKALRARKPENQRKSAYIDFDKTLYDILRKCKKRNKEFNISVDYLRELWSSQGGRCAISNIPLEVDAIDYIRQISLDRIDSSMGYIEGNVRFVSCAINLAKHTMSDKRMHDLLKLVCENYKPRR